MASAWTNSKRGRVPDKIKKNQFIGENCSGENCEHVFQQSTEMFGCKGPSLPVSASARTTKAIIKAFEDEGLCLSDGCDSKSATYLIYFTLNYLIYVYYYTLTLKVLLFSVFL